MPSKEEEFIKNFKPLSASEVSKEIQAKNEAIKKYVVDNDSCEAELDALNNMLTPLLHPITKNPLCWVRTPKIKEIEAFAPPEARMYRGKEIPQKLQEEINIKYQDLIFDMMATFIVTPRRTSAEWKEKGSNPVFIKLFESFLNNLMLDMEQKAENF